MTDEVIQPPEGVKVTDRGFWHWPEIKPRTSSETIRFYESSAAASYRGSLDPIEGPFAWLAVDETTVHLTYDEVKNLRDQMNQWITVHAYADGSPQ